MAESFNHMLDRLEGAFSRQREFVADASHELRTPLTVLRGEIELLGTRSERGACPARSDPSQLLREIRRMERLVDDMLTLAAAESGALIHPRRIDLDEFFDDLSRDLPLLGPRDYRVETAGGTLKADPDRLAQVLRNLVRNAVAHTGADGRITVGAHADDGRLEFSVADTGTGIPSSSSRGCSTASTGPTRAAPETPAAAGSGWRSRERSSRPTAAESGPSRSPAKGRRSGSRCRATSLGR